ncbi:MAG TPA: hypothetical protein VGI78_04975 [Acetobacteraceae bacterium]
MSKTFAETQGIVLKGPMAIDSRVRHLFRAPATMRFRRRMAGGPEQYGYDADVTQTR